MLFAIFGAVLLYTGRPLATVGCAVQGLRNRLTRGRRPPMTGLATLAYRVASYWLPLLAGPPAYLLFRRRYGRPAPRRATPDKTA